MGPQALVDHRRQARRLAEGGAAGVGRARAAGHPAAAGQPAAAAPRRSPSRGRSAVASAAGVVAGELAAAAVRRDRDHAQEQNDPHLRARHGPWVAGRRPGGSIFSVQTRLPTKTNTKRDGGSAIRSKSARRGIGRAVRHRESRFPACPTRSSARPPGRSRASARGIAFVSGTRIPCARTDP